MKKISDRIFYVGVNDDDKVLFEGLWPLPVGVSYNSYLVVDEKVALIDTVECGFEDEFLANIEDAIDDRQIDFLVVNHMEPDHSSLVSLMLERYPSLSIVANAKTLPMLKGYYGVPDEKVMVMAEGDLLSLGSSSLRFHMIPMVHWPETMVTWLDEEGTVFAGDAFGTFGSIDEDVVDNEDTFEQYRDEMMRYYSNIVGKYGKHVQKVLGKAGGIKIARFCPLHGQVWDKDLDYIIDKYQHWSTYEPEVKGVVVAYASMYGNTEAAANLLAQKLDQKGVKDVSVINLMMTHPSYLVADAFKYSNIVLAAPTYNNGLQPMMRTAIEDMASMAVQKRRFSIIANGSWSAASEKVMKDMLAEMEEMTQVGESFIIRSSMKPEQDADLDALADAIKTSLE